MTEDNSFPNMNTFIRSVQRLTHTKDIQACEEKIRNLIQQEEMVGRLLTRLEQCMHREREQNTHLPCVTFAHELFRSFKREQEEHEITQEILRHERHTKGRMETDVLEYRQNWVKERDAVALLQQKNLQLKNKLDSFICCICYEGGSNVILFPCGHAQFCHLCTRRLRQCPICREPITRHVTYHS